MEYKVISLDRSKSWDYKSKMDLLVKVKEGFGDYFRLGVDNLVRGNYFLNKCCHHWGEAYTEVESFYNIVSESYDYKTYKYPRELMIVDSYGRTVNLPDLAEEAWDIELPSEEPYYGRYWVNNHNEEWWEDSWWWTLYVKRNRHKSYMGYNGRDGKGLQQERKLFYDPMHRPFVRGKRTPHMLDPYGLAESNAKAQITWKQMKIKKQWMEKLI